MKTISYDYDVMYQAILKESFDRAHSLNSPSTLKSKAICTGYIPGYVANEEAAIRGTVGHKAVELDNPAIVNPEDEELVNAVNMCISYVNSIRGSYGVYPYAAKDFYFEEVLERKSEPVNETESQKSEPVNETESQKSELIQDSFFDSDVEIF
jgi:hypothetical protein